MKLICHKVTWNTKTKLTTYNNDAIVVDLYLNLQNVSNYSP